MQYLALSCAMQKAGVGEESLGMIFSGDLLNQCVSSAYGLLDYNVPFIGLFGARARPARRDFSRRQLSARLR